MQPFSGDMLQVLATFSAVGFAISFALPALLASRWNLLRTPTPRERLVEFDIRFIASFSTPKAIGFSLILGISSILAGLLILMYQVTSITIVVELAVWIELFVMIGVIAMMVSIWISTTRVSRKEILKVLEYSEQPPRRKPSRTRKRKKEDGKDE